MEGLPDWDDLRIFLELARTRRLSSAARRLRIEHTTVSRRLARLERDLGARLFDRRPEGYVVTEAGEALLPHAEAAEAALAAAVDQLAGRDVAVSGCVRLGAPEGWAARVLTPRLGELLERHPGLDLELLALPRFPSLASREADLVMTLVPPGGAQYVVNHIGDFRYLLYASPDYLARHGPIEAHDLARHGFVDYVQDYLLAEDLRYLDALCLAPRRRFSSTGMLAQLEAVAAGIGPGVLAAYLGDGDARLQPVLRERIGFARGFWLAAHPDLLRLARVRVVWDFIRQLAEDEAERLWGGVPPARGTRAG